MRERRLLCERTRHFVSLTIRPSGRDDGQEKRMASDQHALLLAKLHQRLSDLAPHGSESEIEATLEAIRMIEASPRDASGRSFHFGERA
jgi:hypothetical protein